MSRKCRLRMSAPQVRPAADEGAPGQEQEHR